MTTNSPSEKRLEELREQAWKEGVVPGRGVDVAGGPIPKKPGYYGQPVVKPPVWTWEIPLYFFFGGIAGMSAVIALGAAIFDHVDLARVAMWIAAIACVVAAGVLILGAAIFGTLLATYTGVLIGATAIPAWFLHRTLLPIHFGTAGLGSAAAVLELLGHRIPALNFIGFYTATIELTLLIWLSIDKHGAADRAIHEHGSGWLIRIGEVLNGPVALVLRFFGFVPLAAISFLLGSLVSRIGWLAVGKISGSDPESVFAAERY